MKKVVIVHGAGSKTIEDRKKLSLPLQNKGHWIPWTKEKLEEKGYEVYNPLMPEDWYPNYYEWKEEFEKISIDEETILVGTSAGGAFLVRWLGDTKKKVKKLILIAPIKISDEHLYLKDFLDFKIEQEVKRSVEKIIIFTSDNDIKVILESVKIYHEKLGGKLIELPGRGHFTEKHMGTNEFPELLEAVLN